MRIFLNWLEWAIRLRTIPPWSVRLVSREKLLPQTVWFTDIGGEPHWVHIGEKIKELESSLGREKA